jgi:hypothetical protein
MTVRRVFSLALLLVLAATPIAALACESAGPNTHVGVVTAIDSEKQSLSLKDAESGKVLTFSAGVDLLKGIALRDQVIIVYAAEGKTLRATSIKKG